MTCCPYWIKITKLEVTTTWSILYQFCILHVWVCAQSLNSVQLFVTPLTHQASLSMGFPRQAYWTGLPFSPPGGLPDLGIKPTSPVCPALQVNFLPLSHLGSPLYSHHVYIFFFIDSHPIHLSIKLCDIIYLMFHFTNFIHILFQLAVCVQYYNVVHKKLVHLFGLLTGSMWSSLIIILYQSLI